MSVRSIALELIQRVIVRAIRDDGKVQIAQVEGDAPSDAGADLFDLETLLPYGFSSNPPVGAEAVALQIGGDGAQAVAFGAQHRDHRPKGLASGESCLHYLGDVKVFLKDDGSVFLGAKDASEAAVLGNALKSAFDAHVHATPFGPTAAPAPLPSSVLSSIVKVK